MPTLRLIHSFLQENTSDTQKLMKMPFIDSTYLNFSQVLKLKFEKINSRGVFVKTGDFKNLKGLGTFIGH